MRLRAVFIFLSVSICFANTKIVDTPLAKLRLNSQNGNLEGVTWKDPGTELIKEPRLGENFRLLLPRPGCEANYFVSGEQQVSRIEERNDGVTLTYDSLRNAREKLNVKVLYHIRAVGSRLEFSIEVENPTDLPLAEVFFGILGGQHGIGNRLDTETLVPGVYTNMAPSLFTRFQAGGYGGGNLGIRYSAGGYTYPGSMTMSWMEIYNRRTGLGLYYADHDPETRFSALYFELRPFNKTAVVGDNWPLPADVPPGEPIGLTMGWLKFPYVKKGTFRAGPVVAELHRGDWHEGSGLYRVWFDQHFQVRRPPTWLRKEMAWQSIIMSNCEDVVVHRFKDLPRLAADAKKYGVTTFEILGWDIGGIDRGYPEYRPEPRLGTAAEFQEALMQIRKLGVHPLIFANVQFADTATPLFKQRLRSFAVHGRWTEDLRIAGWGEGTISARMGLTRSNMTTISPAYPEVRKLLVDQFVDLVRDGAEGLQLDKTNGMSMDFNPRLPVSPDRSLTSELLATFQEVLAKCRKVNPAFALASEIWWDRTFPMVDVAYIRMNEIDMNSPVLRYTFPEWTSTIFAENPGDFNVMNNGMRYGLVWALAPRHYNDSMDEPVTRPLSEYVRELIRIRAKHKDVLFHGRFLDTAGAEVKGGRWVRHAVFEGMSAPGKACVVVNYDNDETAAEIRWPGADGREVELLQPFRKDTRVRLPVTLRLPPRSCAVVATP
ncbi:MAG: DUF6259 domain-containing protein [Bryobacteraceae bacterium]